MCASSCGKWLVGLNVHSDTDLILVVECLLLAKCDEELCIMICIGIGVSPSLSTKVACSSCVFLTTYINFYTMVVRTFFLFDCSRS